MNTDNFANDKPLTLEILREALDKLRPVLYYQATKWIEPGALYHCKETEFSPECLIFHPDDEPQIRQVITTRRLVPLKDEPKAEHLSRLQKAVEKQLRETFDKMFLSGGE